MPYTKLPDVIIGVIYAFFFYFLFMPNIQNLELTKKHKLGIFTLFAISWGIMVLTFLI